jgi:putative hydrolase of the HAD superfamily
MRSTARPNAIIFDLDGTLIDAYGRRLEAWTRLIASHQGSLGAHSAASLTVAIMEIIQETWDDPAKRVGWAGDLRAARRRIVAGAFARIGLADAALATRIADQFSDAREHGTRLHDGALETLTALAAAGIGLALLTNGAAATQREKIERFGLADYFSHILVEEEIGAGKPEPEAFERALAALGASADETWMIGDDLGWDIAGAAELGIHAVWYNPDGAALPADAATTPDREIRKLAELVDLAAPARQ